MTLRRIAKTNSHRISIYYDKNVYKEVWITFTSMFEFKMILIIYRFVINVLGTYTMCLEGGDWPTLFDSNIPQVIKKKPF